MDFFGGYERRAKINPRGTRAPSDSRVSVHPVYKTSPLRVARVCHVLPAAFSRKVHASPLSVRAEPQEKQSFFAAGMCIGLFTRGARARYLLGYTSMRCSSAKFERLREFPSAKLPRDAPFALSLNYKFLNFCRNVNIRVAALRRRYKLDVAGSLFPVVPEV